MSALSLRLPESLHSAAREEAAKEGISINQLIAAALGEKLAALKTVDYLRQRAQDADVADWDAIFALVPDVEPDERDRLT